MNAPHMVSNCCGSSARNDMEEEMQLCSGCGEHCEYEEADEYNKNFFSTDDRGDNAWFHDPDMGAKG